MPFPSLVNSQPAIAVAGDFASINPRAFVLAGAGGLVSGASGVTIGRAAWLSQSYIDPENAAMIANSFGYGPIAGLVPRAQQALITAYLADSSMVIPSGFQMSLLSNGDMFVKNEGSGYANAGMKAYANFSNGAFTFAATGSASTSSGSASSVAAGTSSFTGSIAGNVLTVAGTVTGTIYPGTTISGTGVSSGTQIVFQLSGTPGGAGTYAVSITEQTVASTTISGTYGILTIGGTVTGTITVGGLISGTGTVAGTSITAGISGAGGAGTYVVNNNTVVSSTAISATTNVETKFVAMSAGAAGELIKISSHVLG